MRHTTSPRIALSRIAVSLALASSMAVASLAQADEGPDDLYVGVGLFGDMLNVNLEYVSEDWGNLALRVGQFQGVNTGVAGNVSWRKPITADDPTVDGYFVGVFAGQIMGDTPGGVVVDRLGVGGEMGYHWVSDYTRKVFSVGLGFPEKVERNGQELLTEPTLFFEFSIGLGY